jgi:transposase InsO family protein
VAHPNARLNVHGRSLLAERVRGQGRPIAHVAKELGISRQCASTWIARFDAQGVAGLADRSSRPHSIPNQTSPEQETAVLTARTAHRCGPIGLARHTGVSRASCARILHRRDIPHLADCDPLTGDVIRKRHSHHRYERDHPGELIHIDVKKVGKIPDGGGWRAHGITGHATSKHLGYDYIHAAIDDHTRLVYAEILPDEKGTTAAGFLTRAAAWYATAGITHIERIMTDNALAYRKSTAFKTAAATIGATQKFIKPHCPWTNGKIERFNRTLQTEWAYRHAYTSNTARHDAFTPWIHEYNYHRPHTALQNQPPASRLSPTS